MFDEAFFRSSPSLLKDLLPEYEHLSDVVRVIDVAAATGGARLDVIMDAEREEAVGFLARAR